MDQIANLVIDLSLDSQKFKDEVPRIKKMLENASDKAEISAQRQKIFWSFCRNRAGHMLTEAVPYSTRPPDRSRR